MKKTRLTSIILATVMILALLTGCGGAEESKAPESQAPASTAPAPESAAPAPESQAPAEIDWPTSSIELIVPFAAGGDSDFNVRAIAQYLTDELGQPVVVTNINGAGGSLAMEELYASEPDGTRFMMMHNSLHTIEAMGLTDYGWDGFDPVCIFAKNPGEVLIVRSDFPADDLKGFIEVTAANPQKYIYAFNTGSTSHYVGVMLERAGASLNKVVIGSSSERVVSLAGGHVDIISTAVPTVQDYLDKGDFKVLAIGADERHASYPDYPTYLEQGVDVSFAAHYTFYAPKGTDPAIIAKMSAACKNVVENNKDYQEDIMTAYMETPYYEDTAETIETLKVQRDRFMAISEELQAGA